jgi:hypothetical protein
MVVCDVTPYSLVARYQCFGRTCNVNFRKGKMKKKSKQTISEAPAIINMEITLLSVLFVKNIQNKLPMKKHLQCSLRSNFCCLWRSTYI